METPIQWVRTETLQIHALLATPGEVENSEDDGHFVLQCALIVENIQVSHDLSGRCSVADVLPTEGQRDSRGGCGSVQREGGGSDNLGASGSA